MSDSKHRVINRVFITLRKWFALPLCVKPGAKVKIFPESSLLTSEYEKVRERVMHHCISVMGKERVKQLQPSVHYDEIQHLLNNNLIDRNNLYKRFRTLSVIWIIWSVFKYGPFPFQ